MRIKKCCYDCQLDLDDECPHDDLGLGKDCEMNSDWCDTTLTVNIGIRERYVVSYCPAHTCEDFKPTERCLNRMNRLRRKD